MDDEIKFTLEKPSSKQLEFIIENVPEHPPSFSVVFRQKYISECHDYTDEVKFKQYVDSCFSNNIIPFSLCKMIYDLKKNNFFPEYDINVDASDDFLSDEYLTKLNKACVKGGEPCRIIYKSGGIDSSRKSFAKFMESYYKKLKDSFCLSKFDLDVSFRRSSDECAHSYDVLSLVSGHIDYDLELTLHESDKGKEFYQKYVLLFNKVKTMKDN